MSARSPRPGSNSAAVAWLTLTLLGTAALAEEEAAKETKEKVYRKVERPPLPDGPAIELSGAIAVVPFDAMVNPGMGDVVISSIEKAEKAELQAVLIELDTPGGLVSTTEKIVQKMLAAKIPVIVHVTPSGAHAASAGAIITLAAHIAAMAPATRIGAAHPVTATGGDPEESGGVHMGRKVENDLAALVEGIAEQRGRNVEWAIDAVRQSVSIQAQKALEIGVIDLVAKDRVELFDKLEGYEFMLNGEKVKLHTKGANVIEYELSLKEKAVNVLTNPGVAMLMLVLAVLGIGFELKAPGMFIPGIFGVLCGICFLIAGDMLPIGLGGMILIAIGLILLITEVYTSTYGVLGILGAVALAFGFLLAFDPNNPEFALDKGFGLGVADVVPMVVMLSGFFFALSAIVVRSRRERPVTGRLGVVGDSGVVLKAVDKDGGMVMVGGEYWKARSRERIPENEPIEVVSVEGLELQVRRKPPA